jgi:hypothetical protein
MRGLTTFAGGVRDRSAEEENDMLWLAGVDGKDGSDSEEEVAGLWAPSREVEDSREALIASTRSSSSEDGEGVCRRMEPAAGCEKFGPEVRELDAVVFDLVGLAT